jgi:nicotinate-nucleotide adenylyltransferase
MGVMGGTFDPIHLGHLRAAETAREALALERVAFVPAAVPPHRAAPAASALDRYAMVCLGTAAHPAFSASDVELRRGGPSYTVDTVEALLREDPRRELVLVVGSDNVGELLGWKDAARLLQMCSVAVVSRPGSPLDAAAPEGRLQRLEGASLDVSASDVRSRVRDGRSIRYLVPDGVADYIEKRGLYR